MPSVESGSDVLAHDQMVVEALERFCSSSEQSYPQFLASFSHLTPVSVGLRNAVVPSALDSLPGQMERHGGRGRRRGAGRVEGVGRCPRGSAAPADQEEILLGDGVAAGACGNGDVPPGTLLKVDNYLAVGDFSQEEEEGPPDSGAVDVLPGEVEEEAPAYLPSFCRRTRLEMSSTARSQGTGEPQASPQASEQALLQDMSESEEVTPFSLDEHFDYDHVALSHKYQPWPRPRPDSQ